MSKPTHVPRGELLLERLDEPLPLQNGQHRRALRLAARLQLQHLLHL